MDTGLAVPWPFVGVFFAKREAILFANWPVMLLDPFLIESTVPLVLFIIDSTVALAPAIKPAN